MRPGGMGSSRGDFSRVAPAPAPTATAMASDASGNDGSLGWVMHDAATSVQTMRPSSGGGDSSLGDSWHPMPTPSPTTTPKPSGGSLADSSNPTLTPSPAATAIKPSGSVADARAGAGAGGVSLRATTATQKLPAGGLQGSWSNARRSLLDDAWLGGQGTQGNAGLGDLGILYGPSRTPAPSLRAASQGQSNDEQSAAAGGGMVIGSFSPKDVFVCGCPGL